MRKILFIALLLTVSVTLTARQKPADQEKQQPQEQEQAMVQRLYETQVSGSDSDFYEAQVSGGAQGLGKILSYVDEPCYL